MYLYDKKKARGLKKAMKRILYTDLSSGFGGSSIVLYDFLKNLSRDKFQPVLFFIRNGPNFEKIKRINVKVIKRKFKVIGRVAADAEGSYVLLFFDFLIHFFPNTLVLWRVMKKEKIDLVHINNNIKFCIDIILAAKLAGIPCVCHIRETRPLGKLDKLFGKYLNKIVVLNRNVLKDFTGVFGPKKVKLIYDGLNFNDPAICSADGSKIRNEFNLTQAFCVGILGRLVESKGFNDFIQAALIVKKANKNVKFLIIGDDPDEGKSYQNYLKGAVRRLNLTNDVIFTGWRFDKFDIISALDVIVQASTTPEGFGLTCVEAMALSKPVIATDIPGPSSIVEEGKTGCLIPPNDPESLAKAIMKLADSPELAKQFGTAGRISAELKFDIRKNVLEIEKIYEGLLN